MKKVRIPTPESGVLRACLDILGAHKIWHERRNTLPVWVDGKGGKRRPVRVSRPGTADIFATALHTETYTLPEVTERISVTYLLALWIECKSDIGEQRPEQRHFQSEVEAAGHYYLVVRKPEDLLAWLKEHGVIS